MGMSGQRWLNWMTKVETIEQVWVHCTECDNEWLLESAYIECGCDEE